MIWKGRHRQQLWPSLRYYPDICLQELRKTVNSEKSPIW